MRRAVAWAVGNAAAMDIFTLVVLLVGGYSLASMRREVFPNFALEVVLVRVVYPGATPAEVEEGVCQKLEEAVRSIEHVKKVTSLASEGLGELVVELDESVPDVQRTLNELRAEVDRTAGLPELAEDPQIQQITFRNPAITVGVVGPAVEGEPTPAQAAALREVAERVRDELLALPAVSEASLQAAPAYQIDVEVPAAALERHGLTLEGVAEVLRRQSAELPAGLLKSDAGTVLLRGDDKRRTGDALATVPLVAGDTGAVVSLGEVARVRDAFADTELKSWIDGSPGYAISILRTETEDMLAMVAAVKAYVRAKGDGGGGGVALPAGYRLVTWNDRSVDVRERMDMLVTNGIQGLVLVFLCLALFLEIQLAFWVALGIPIAMCGAGIYLLWAGQTMNMLSMFAFLMTLGIVVDDAIVVGENVYEHRLQGKSFHDASVDGTVEVIPSVWGSVMTTVIAFLPLLYVSGVMGKFIAVIPVAVIAMLLVSMTEAMSALPSHLAHPDHFAMQVLRVVLLPLWPLGWLLGQAARLAQYLLAAFIDRLYLPLLRAALAMPLVTPAAGIAILVLAAGLVRSGRVPFVIFPKIDNKSVFASVEFPDGTPADVARGATARLEAAIREIDREHRARPGAGPLVLRTYRKVGQGSKSASFDPNSRLSGGHLGAVEVELSDTTARDVTSSEIIARWRARVGSFPGAVALKFGSESHGPGGTPIELQLLARTEDQVALDRAVEECKTEVARFAGTFDVDDNSRPGKPEYRLRVRPHAQALGVTTAQLAGAVRGGWHGAEVMRLQRGRHELKLMVRFPPEERASLGFFDALRVRTADGLERPLSELAEVTVAQGPYEIVRVDQKRAITISADLDEGVGNASEIVAKLAEPGGFVERLVARYPMVSVRWEGQKAQTKESVDSLKVGLVIALLAMYALLVLQFRSHYQPMLIMSIIPFGVIGAIAGHYLLGLPITLFSLFGLVALTGVVVNDSIVLIDFINERVAAGVPLEEALVDAGRRRFRPVFLTSITTIAGLAPIIVEKSYQAQVLIPMAVSLAFGLTTSTVLVVVFIPVFYLLYHRAAAALGRVRRAVLG